MHRALVQLEREKGRNSLLVLLLINDTECKQSWNYRNLQPMWKKDNLVKSNKYSENIQLNIII